MGGVPFFNPWAPPIFAQGAGGLLGPDNSGATDGAYRITPGPDYNKWDEALLAHGRILLPKELDNPQEWLNMPHLQGLLKNYHRDDRPDGSVILSKILPMS